MRLMLPTDANGKAVPGWGLPFSLILCLLVSSNTFAGDSTNQSLTFHIFKSTCLDLGHYDERRKLLTVRFVNGDRERFYRYSHVPEKTWKKLQQLNEKGGVGAYFTDTIVAHPEKFPYERLIMKSFGTLPTKQKSTKTKKAEDSH